MSEPIYGPWQRAAWCMPHRILAPPVGEALPVVEVDWNTSAASEPDWRTDYDPTAQELAAELVRVAGERDEAQESHAFSQQQVRDLAAWNAKLRAERDALGKALLAYVRDEIPFDRGAAWAVDALRAAGLLPEEES